MKTKKLILAALAAMCAMTVTLTSCSQSDNPVGPANGTTITINTAALYQELGITNEINDYLTQDTCYILGTVLLYDQQGNLVTQLSGEAHNLEPMVLKGDGIADGTYTLVVFQMGEKKEKICELVDADRLTDVHLSFDMEYFLSDFHSIGLASQTITVKGGGAEAIVTPKAAGSIVETRIDNFTQGDQIDYLSLTTFGEVTGLYLDPARPANERCIIDNPNYLCVFSAGYDERLKEGSSSWKDFFPYCGESIYTSFSGYHTEEADEEEGFFEITALILDLLPGKHTVFYHDFDPNQLYKTYAGSEEGLDSWLARRAENPYEPKFFTQFGASLAEVERFMDKEYNWWPMANGSLIEYSNVPYWDFWRKGYLMDDLGVCYDFSTADGQNMFRCIFTYFGNQISLETMQREMERQGNILEETHIAASADEMTVYTYLSADGNNRILLRQGDDRWEVYYEAGLFNGSRSLAFRETGSSWTSQATAQPQVACYQRDARKPSARIPVSKRFLRNK